MTHFTDGDIGDLAEEIIGTIDGFRWALKTRLPGDIAASKARESKLYAMAVTILETLGRREPSAKAPKQLSFIPDGPTGLPD